MELEQQLLGVSKPMVVVLLMLNGHQMFHRPLQLQMVDLTYFRSFITEQIGMDLQADKTMYNK
jgi:hypothetical protein